MAYLAPIEFVTKMVDAGESKLLMSLGTPSFVLTWQGLFWLLRQLLRLVSV